jgi:glycosyltransferase involved in cell wall biosynthesis
MNFAPRNMTAAMFSIVQVAGYSPNYSGNFIASLRSAATEYGKRGLKPVWVFPEEARGRTWVQALAKGGASVHILPRQGGHFRYAWRLAQIARSENAAIMHTHFSRFDIAAWMAKMICVLAGKHIEVIWHAHSAFQHTGASAANPSDPAKTRLLLHAIKLGLMGRACHLVAVSEELSRSLRERGCRKNRMRLIPNGIDIQRCLLRTKSRQQMRDELKVTNDALLLLGFGWEPVIKGVDTMLEALAHTRSSGRNAFFVLVGTDRLQRFVDQWPDRSVIPFVRVIPPVECVGDLFGAADSLVFASRAEGFPYSLAEAMVNGVPIASTRIPSLAWAFEAPGIFFFESENSRELARVIDRIARRTADQLRLDAELSRRFVEERYSVEGWTRSVMQLYENLLPDARVRNPRSARAQKQAAV